MKSKLILGVFLIVASLGAWTVFQAEESKREWKKDKGPEYILNKKTVKAVGEAYQKDIEPLFKQSCYDCHSKYTVYPWYHAIPGVKQLIDGDVRDGMDKLDMSDGYPFNTDTPLVKHLRRIYGNVKRGSMPPWNYRLMHAQARLSEEDKKKIEDWASQGLYQLTSTAKIKSH